MPSVRKLMIAAVTLSLALNSQAQSNHPAPSLTFEVASVKQKQDRGTSTQQRSARHRERIFCPRSK